MDCVVLKCLLAFVWLKTCYAGLYSHTWAAHIEGGEKVARLLAEKHGFTYLGKIVSDHYHLSHSHVSKRSLTPNEFHHSNLKNEPQVKWLEQQVIKRRVKRDIGFNDPKWSRMWYLNRGGGLDMNVTGAWQKGHCGKGVVVSILDDGIEKDHPDLKKNYDPHASYDVNAHDPDPQPRYDYTNENRHGTRCAGEVAAEANNGFCNVGVAYEASIGGVRMLDGDVTDAVEATSLSLNPQHIDIYSASWGPDDDGRTVDGPAALARKAFKDGIYEGRGGKGNIFVWASGNGGRDQDSCNCDGYTNSIYTLSISSATESGHIPWYSEACSSTLSTTYSSGSGKEHQVITTDLRKGCTESHTGTSASAPLAAGICALALSANKQLTWRDMQHIVVMTSRPSNLKANDWVTNGFGKKVSHSFGFGLMDASAMVDLALNWTNVPQQHICTIKSHDSPRYISVNGKVSVSLQSDGCMGTANEVNYLEHVQAVITLSTSRRGQVQIFLTSPSGTRSTLLTKRPKDGSSEGFKEWAFMTTHNWGENSHGSWILEIENQAATFYKARLRSWSLVLYGTQTDPYNDTPIETTSSPTTNTPQTTVSQKPKKYDLNNPSIDVIKLPPCKPKRKPKHPNRRPKYGLNNTSNNIDKLPPFKPQKTKYPSRRPWWNLLIREPATLSSWSLKMYGTKTDPLKDQQHNLPQDCYEGNLHAQNLTCVDKCPISFYAVNKTTSQSPSLVQSTTTTTTTSTTTTVKTQINTTTTVNEAGSSASTSTGATSSQPQSTTTAEQITTTVTCLPCAVGCAQCTDKDHCITCSEGYNITVNATCVSNESVIIKYLKKHISMTIISILSIIALIIFLLVFCILQLLEPKSCFNIKVKYGLLADVESGKKGLKLPNGIRYDTGTKKIDSKGLLESSESDNDI